ncbi:hypothetical protein KI387_000823, partial [Taxus chinensis]
LYNTICLIPLTVTSDGQLLVGMPISIAAHLAPTPLDNTTLLPASLALSPNPTASEVHTTQIGFPL